MRIRELTDPPKPETIRSATKGTQGIDRARAERIYDPRGYFARNRRAIKAKRTK